MASLALCSVSVKLSGKPTDEVTIYWLRYSIIPSHGKIRFKLLDLHMELGTKGNFCPFSVIFGLLFGLHVKHWNHYCMVCSLYAPLVLWISSCYCIPLWCGYKNRQMCARHLSYMQRTFQLCFAAFSRCYPLHLAFQWWIWLAIVAVSSLGSGGMP